MLSAVLSLIDANMRSVTFLSCLNVSLLTLLLIVNSSGDGSLFPPTCTVVRGIARLDEIRLLRVTGLVLGPLHQVLKDQPFTLGLKCVDPRHGCNDDLIHVLEKAHKKGISVVLDLTPNYLGEDPWFNTNSVDCELIEQVKVAAEFWLDLGFDGIKLPYLPVVWQSVDWRKLRADIRGNRPDYIKKKALMGIVNNFSAEEVFEIINTTDVDLILSDLLRQNQGKETIRVLNILRPQRGSICWGLGATQNKHLSKSTALIRLYQLLLLTLPGTPVFTYGDEIGLNAQAERKEREERVAVKKWFKTLSELRGKERSLLHGDYYSLYSSDSSLAFLRLWDQSERYITAVNWGTTPEKLTLKTQEEVKLPEKVKVKLSTDENLKEDSSVSLDSITLGPGQSVLLQFPYTG